MENNSTKMSETVRNESNSTQFKTWKKKLNAVESNL